MSVKTAILHHPFVCAGIGVLGLFAVGFGTYRGMYEYVYFRDHKTVRSIKLLHFDDRRRCEVTLPVKFVSAMHDAGVIQKHLVRADSGKSFLIFRFDDGRIQLMAFPVRRYPGIGWMTAFYTVTDTAAEGRLRNAMAVCTGGER